MARRNCNIMADDINRLANLSASFATGAGPNAVVFGPADRDIFVTIKCRLKSPKLPGGCGSYEITREGAAVEKFGLKRRSDVGNLYGLTHQISRDLARLWGCHPLPAARGFEGPPRPKRKRRRR